MARFSVKNEDYKWLTSLLTGSLPLATDAFLTQTNNASIGKNRNWVHNLFTLSMFQ
jgi:hypothetical protein